MQARNYFEALNANLPKLHCWSGEFSLGGFNEWVMEKLFSFLEREGLVSGGKSFVETGAGLSTLLFLCAAPKEVLTVTLESSEFSDRLYSAAKGIGLSTDCLSMNFGKSERLLPPLLLERQPFADLVLLDGGHGWPTVFVDFCYLSYATKQNGFVVLDDTQLYSVSQLVEFLKEQPGWELVLDLGKIVAFKKLYADRLLPDFGGQPYILRNSK